MEDQGNELSDFSQTHRWVSF